MIIKGRSRRNRRFWTKHLLNTKENDRVRPVEFRGFLDEDIVNAMRDMETVAKETRCKTFFYMVSINPERGENLTEEQALRSADVTEKELGFDGLPRFIVEHEKKGRKHYHVAWLRIDLDTMTARDDSLTYRKHERAARKIEKELGLKPTASVLVKDRGTERPKRRPNDYEGFREKQSGLETAEVAREVTDAWRMTDTGIALQAALLTSGYILCEGRRGLCIVDPAGKEHSLARRIDGARAADLEARLSDIDRKTLPTVQEARKLAHLWGDNDAARAVRSKAVDNALSPFLQVRDKGQEETPEERERHDREKRMAYATGWGTLPKESERRAWGVKPMPEKWADKHAPHEPDIEAPPPSWAEREHRRKQERKALTFRPWRERVQADRELEPGH